MMLFHQNMRNFGGGTAWRNAAYTAQFTAALAASPAPIGVTGFTEITNNGAAAVESAVLCGNLGVGHVANIACGNTVLANGPEYISIGVLGGLNILRVGRIFLCVDGGGVHLLDDWVAPALVTAAWCNRVPAAATRDFRGLVYVIVQDPATLATFCVGFLHNMYTFIDQRILIMGQIPRMLTMINNAAGGALHAAYIGGDFNVPASLPVDTRGTHRIGFAYGYSSGLLPPGPVIPPPPPTHAFTPGGTTWAGNLYDFWYSTIQPGVAPPAPYIPPVAGVFGGTLDSVAGGGGNLMSDHCGAVLRIG